MANLKKKLFLYFLLVIELECGKVDVILMINTQKIEEEARDLRVMGRKEFVVSMALNLSIHINIGR